VHDFHESTRFVLCAATRSPGEEYLYGKREMVKHKFSPGTLIDDELSTAAQLISYNESLYAMVARRW